MKITILQQNIVWSNPEANRKIAEEAFDRNPDAELYVLPEMFSTGFCTEPEGIAERNGDSLTWMKQQAAQRNAAIAGSIATEVDGKYYKCFLSYWAILPSGFTK